jgi:eukaryotic-like serine/threonine-protein kinase
MIGKTIGKYRILDRLGRGGMGTVYRAVDETLDREVAIKVLNPDFGEADVLKRFRAEAVILARLNHPGIATIYELYRQDDDLLMVMEYVRGETLHALSDRLGPLAVPQAAHLCMQVLDALAHAHRAGVIHRDLKPANVMIADTGGIKVMDFGIARVLGTEHFTHAGYMMGTPAYMAPEQVLGKEVDGRSDLYALGVVFYRLLAGELPFRADTSIAMVQKQIAEPPTPISTFRPDLPAWCGPLIDRALAKAPSDRFQSAEAFRAAFGSAVRPEALGELPTAATPSPGLPISAELTMPRPNSEVAAARSDRVAADPSVRDLTTRRVPKASGESTPAATARTLDRTPTAVVLGRTHLVTLGAMVALLVAAVALLAFLAFRGGSRPDPATPAETPAAAAKVDAAPAARAMPPPAPPDLRQLATIPKPLPPSRGRADAAPGVVEAPKPPADRALPDGSRTDPVGPPARILPAEPDVPLIVEDIHLAVHVPGRGVARERNGVLRLGNGQIAVLDRSAGSTIVSVPYASIIAAFVSRGRQPRWRRPDGTEGGGVVEPGRLGFLKARPDRNWLTLMARNQMPVVIRLEDGAVRTVVMGVNSRTGIPVQRVLPR